MCVLRYQQKRVNIRDFLYVLRQNIVFKDDDVGRPRGHPLSENEKLLLPIL